MIDWSAFLNERTGIVGILTALVVAFMKGYIVPGWMYRHSQSRTEKLEIALMDTLGLSREAVNTAHTMAKRRSNEQAVTDEPT